jgi:acetyltransferase-like isoleucine patch superfamily enzyme
MATMTKRHVSLPEAAEAGVRAFIEDTDERLSGATDEQICDVVRDVLVDLFGHRQPYERWRNGGEVTPAQRVRMQSYDPCNVTLESEYYAEVANDVEAYKRSKYLQWLWRQFDATPMADNVDFALRFRQMLAKHLFRECGDDCRFFKGITFTYGHNITIGDNVVIHDDVHLDDRGELEIGDRVSISDGTHVYSHDHDVVDQTEVLNYRTVIGDDVRLTFDSMVRAGVRVGENALVGARANVQRDVPAHHIVVGAPAKSVSVKPGFEDAAVPVDADHESHRDERELAFSLPADLDVFDEFDRPPELSTPVQPHREP